MGVVGNTRVAILGAIHGFHFFPSPWFRLVELASHPGTDLVGADDSYGRQMPPPRPSWSTPDLLGRLDWWGRCLGPSESLAISLGHCHHVSVSRERTSDCCPQKIGPVVVSTHSCVTSPLGWTCSRYLSGWN